LERRILSLRTLILGNALVLALVYSLHALFPTALLGFELKILDSRFQARQALGLAPAFSEQLVHINIDSYSKDQSGDSLWEKKVYAKLIQEIAKGYPEAIACDIMFVEWADQADNASVVNAVIEAGNLVSPFLFSETADAASQPPPQAMGLTINPRLAPGSARHATGVLVGPIEDLMEHSAGLGFVNLSPDADGVIRRVPVVVEMSGALVPSFFLQALAIQLDYDLENISLVDRSHIILRDFPAGSSGSPRDLPLPLDEDGNLIVNFSGPLSLTNYPHSYSAWDLLKKTPARPDFSGKLVFLADTSPQNSQYGDISPIPLDNAFPRAYIWSNAANSLLAGAFVTPVGYGFGVIATLLLCTLVVLAAWRFNTVWFGVISLGSLVFYSAIAFGSFAVVGWLLPVLSVLLPLVGVYLFSSIYRYAQLEHYEGVLEGSLKSYLSPVLMDRIKSDPGLLKLGGNRKRITVLFSDIVDFTSFSDQADPQEIQDVLETHFSDAASIIFAEDGIVDKYLGDGILAFFENDGENLTSAVRATRCALRMQERAIELDRLYRSQNRFPFAIRIGLATGYASVGNIGPAEKIDYTVIGSVVNLASRLQSGGEPGSVVIEKDTGFFIKDKYHITSLGQRALKGFADPVEVYVVDGSQA